VDLVLSITWSDERLTETFTERGWRTDLQFLNGRDVEIHPIRAPMRGADGDWNAPFRIQGAFRQHFDLQRFPNDVQRLTIHMVAPSIREGFRVVPTAQFAVESPTTSSAWTFSNLETRSETVPALLAGRPPRVDVTISIDAKRDPRFYLWRVVLPLCMIVFMSWSVFWMEPSQLEAQLQVSCSAVITLIAFEMSLTSVLPEVSYLTSLDLFVLGATVFVFTALGESVVTSALAERKRFDAARRIDRLARLVFPASFVVLLAVISLLD
jgi:hypothetical protein